MLMSELPDHNGTLVPPQPAGVGWMAQFDHVGATEKVFGVIALFVVP